MVNAESQQAERDNRRVNKQCLGVGPVHHFQKAAVLGFLAAHLIRCDEENENANAAREQRMHACPKQKCYEILDIPVPDACANPRTVVIVHLHAHAALTTVEGSGRPQNLARVTVTHLVVAFARLDVPVVECGRSAYALGIVAGREVFEFV